MVCPSPSKVPSQFTEPSEGEMEIQLPTVLEQTLLMSMSSMSLAQAVLCFWVVSPLAGV